MYSNKKRTIPHVRDYNDEVSKRHKNLYFNQIFESSLFKRVSSQQNTPDVNHITDTANRLTELCAKINNILFQLCCVYSSSFCEVSCDYIISTTSLYEIFNDQIVAH